MRACVRSCVRVCDLDLVAAEIVCIKDRAHRSAAAAVSTVSLGVCMGRSAR